MGRRTPGTDDEARILNAARQGDTDAFGRLVDRYRDRVYGVAFRIVGNAEDATDIAQEAFIRAWRSLPKFRGGAGFFTWIYRIATNLALDHLRRRKTPMVSYEDGALLDRADDLPGPAPTPSPRTEAIRAELRDALDQALAQLSPEHRTVLVLREYEGLSYQEIAAALGCRIGTVMSRLHYARRRARELLGDLL